ncbi:hypothetical protein BDF22DRAFT_662391 [Syncephalis plumigaleata]|nr:hypothetical protein BDF22DRAFT_662391 [Syncephalis plumigaleata]
MTTITTSQSTRSPAALTKIDQLPYEVLWYILLYTSEDRNITAFMRASKYIYDVCQSNVPFWLHRYRQYYSMDRIEHDIIEWLKCALLAQCCVADPCSSLSFSMPSSSVVSSRRHAYLIYMLRGKLGRRWSAGVPLQLSPPIDQLKLAPLSRDDYWKIVATAVWGGIWWSSIRGEAYIGILKGSDESESSSTSSTTINEDPLQIYPLLLPSEIQINHRCHPVFLAGRHHAVVVTPSNTKLSNVVAWSIDVSGCTTYENGGNGLSVRSWLLREITSAPTIQDNWLACVSMEQSELSVQVRLFPEPTPDTVMSTTPQSVLTLINLNRPDKRIYQFVDIGNTAYHFHGMYQQSAIIFAHQLQERSSLLSWQLGCININNQNDTHATSSWRYLSQGRITLASSISRYLFTSKRLDTNRVLLQGSNLFGTNGCLALIDVSAKHRTTATTTATATAAQGAPSPIETGFVWLNNHLYKTVVPLVSANKIIACPPPNEPDSYADENTAALILDLNTGNILVSISGANWVQVEPIFGSLIAIGITETWDISECFILDINRLTSSSSPSSNTNTNTNDSTHTLPTSSRRNETRSNNGHRLSSTRLASSIRRYSFDDFEIRSMPLSMSDSITSVMSGLSSDNYPHGHQQKVIVLKYTCHGLWHVSPTALMSSFVIKLKNSESTYPPRRTLTNSMSIKQLATEPESTTQEEPCYLRHFAYSLY